MKDLELTLRVARKKSDANFGYLELEIIRRVEMEEDEDSAEMMIWEVKEMTGNLEKVIEEFFHPETPEQDPPKPLDHKDKLTTPTVRNPPSGPSPPPKSNGNTFNGNPDDPYIVPSSLDQRTRDLLFDVKRMLKMIDPRDRISWGLTSTWWTDLLNLPFEKKMEGINVLKKRFEKTCVKTGPDAVKEQFK